MFRIPVIAGNAKLVAFLVTDDHTGCQRIQLELFASLGKQLDCRVIGSLYHSTGTGQIRTGEAGSTSVLDTVRFTHLHTNVGVVRRSTTMPSTMVPRKGLIYIPRVGINEGMDTCPVIAGTVPKVRKGLGRWLGTTHRVEHQTLDCDLLSRLITWVLGQDRLDDLHA
jgi:hypothetical protein